MTASAKKSGSVWSRLSLKWKLLTIGALGIVATVLVAGVATYQSARMEDQTQRLSRAEAAITQALQIDVVVADLNGWQNAYAADVLKLGALPAIAESSPNRKGYLERQAQGTKLLAQVKTSEYDAQQLGQLKAMQAAWKKFIDTDDQIVQTLKLNTKESTAKALKTVDEEEVQNYGALLKASQELRNSLGERSAAAAESQRQVAAQSQIIMLLVPAIVAVLLGLLAWFVAAQIIKALKSVQASVQAMAHNDLTVPAAVVSHDELGEMAEDCERMREQMRGVLDQVSQASSTVAAASEELSATSSQVGAGAAESSQSLQHTSKAADEVSANVQTVAAGTEEMTASIREIAKSANSAADVAAQAVTVADQTNSTVTQLGESSQEIGNVIKVITSIAEQTNLLALNATIEAARAGEAGKGFAVVANEVKELAQETSKATEDISHRVEQIQADANAAVAAISEIGSIIAQINDTQSTIASAVEEQTATTNEMSRSVAEAADGSSSIATNITTAAQVAEGSADAAQNMAQASRELATRSTELQELVAQFTV